jgi:DNA-binding transcriptional ArsR family regulator
VKPFTAIADPVRRRIVERLADGEKTAGELGEGFAISQPAMSRHLRVLREAGLVAARADAQRRLYRLTPAPLAQVDDWLTSCRKLWEERFDALKAYVEETGSQRLTPIPARYPGRPASPAGPCKNELIAVRAA